MYKDDHIPGVHHSLLQFTFMILLFSYYEMDWDTLGIYRPIPVMQSRLTISKPH